ncbi:MAG: SLC26A/SulP transporter family protein [Anaerolineae bacterium]|nr:SLC26A/SulP transporter family protein [Anaerolineae bacterium]
MSNTSSHHPTFIPAISAGLVTAILDIIISISFAAMIFSGEFAVFLPRGIGIALFSTMIVCAILAVASQFRGVISVAQDAGIVILAGVAQRIIATADDPTANGTFVTMAVFIALSSLITGLFFLILGRFRLGNLIRFIPYPVIGGFLAAVGIILIQGAFSMTADYSIALSTLDNLIAHDALIRWLPALIFGVVMFGVTRYNSHYLVMPALLILGMIVFFVIVLLSGESIDAVQDKGWMLGPFSESTAWKPVFLEDFAAIDWDAILAEIWYIPAIALVSAIALLLNISGMEVQADDELNINRELETIGLTNFGIGLTGAFIGFPTISITLLSWRMKGKSRLTGLVFAALFLVVLIFGFSLIAYFPKFVLGGLLIFLGIAILTEWVYDSWCKMPRQDYVIMLVILGIITTEGYLQGVGFGLIAAAALFAFNYSRIGNIKQTLTGQTYQSKVNRPPMFQHELHTQGQRLMIYRLYGYIFFGSANNLLDKITEQTDADLHFLVLDFQQVPSVDSSAILTFIRLHQLLRKRQTMLVLCGMSPTVHDVFARSDFDLADRKDFHLFAELDEAVEWCENQWLYQITLAGTMLPLTMQSQLEALCGDCAEVEQIINYMERREVPAGMYLDRQGAPASDLYWVESGRLRAHIESDKTHQRLRIAQAGTVIGEIALYADTTRSASIVADEPSVVYVLTRDALHQMETNDPALAARFHKLIARIVSERLADTTASLEHYL